VSLQPIHCTEVLSKYGNYGLVPSDVLCAAQDRGKAVHKICSSIALGLPIFVEPDETIAGYVKSFTQWYKTAVDEVVLAETELVSQRWKVICTPDLIVRLRSDPALAIVDLKTPVSESRLWRAQLAMYMCCALELGFDVRRYLAVRLDRDGKFPKVTEYTTYKRDLLAYLHALAAHRYFVVEED